jgi:hypothetical protein
MIVFIKPYTQSLERTAGNVAYLYPHGLPQRVTDRILNATFAVEEKLRTNFSTASSLPCRGAPYFACPPIAGQAAVLGQREKAADLLRLAWRNYTLPPYHLWREYSHYNFGMYITHAVRTTFNFVLSIFLMPVLAKCLSQTFSKPNNAYGLFSHTGFDAHNALLDARSIDDHWHRRRWVGCSFCCCRWCRA